MKKQKWISGLIAVVAGIVLLMSSSGDALAASLVGTYKNPGAGATLEISSANDSTGVFHGHMTIQEPAAVRVYFRVTGEYSFTGGGHVGDPTAIVFEGIVRDPSLTYAHAIAGAGNTKAYEYNKINLGGAYVSVGPSHVVKYSIGGIYNRQ
ncbi:MAG: hypothetical protein GDA56_28440 [Hormoscilla sp. GM7CHS1pb]|nr:hypothetical protein [Hormoscilla sp. GM7CHS1pb]